MTNDGDLIPDNPYAAPQVREIDIVPPRSLIRRMPFVLLVGLAAYAVFIGILLDSVADDVPAGMLMAVHLMLLIAGTVFVFYSGASCVWVGIAGVVGQIVVTGIMLVAAIGEPWAVITVNGWIIFGFALITVWYFAGRWLRRPVA